MTQPSTTHASFTVERHYPASPARVFAAWADLEQKNQWFGPADPGTAIFDFRPGGREFRSGTAPHGQAYSFDVSYRDIVPDARIVYTYEMHLDGRRISVSVASVEVRAEGKGTHLVVSEHGIFLDGLDTCAQREAGTAALIDQLGRHLAKV